MIWKHCRTPDDLFVSAITQAEILLGIALLPAGKRREALASAAKTMFTEDFAGAILPFDKAPPATTRRWSRIAPGSAARSARKTPKSPPWPYIMGWFWRPGTGGISRPSRAGR
jgi:hypothetical protein